MSQRLTRKEIKRDEFATAVERSVEYAESHGRALALAVGGAALLVAVGFGVYFFLGSRSATANEALAKAITVYQAPVQAADAKPDDSETPSFPTAAARQARAKQLFTELHEAGGSDAADIAALYLGRIAADERDLERARSLWSEFLDDHEGHVLAGEARLNLIRLDRAQGKGEEVVGRLKPMLDEAEPPMPKDLLLFELAQTYEEMDRKDEALAAYRKVADEYPQSAYAQPARQQIAALDPARAGGAPGLGGMGGAGGLTVLPTGR